MSAIGGGSLGSTLKQWLQDILVSAHIVSPRFDDYRIESLDWYSEPSNLEFEKAIEQEVQKILRKEGIVKKSGSARTKKSNDSTLDAVGSVLRGSKSFSMGPQMLARFLPPVAIALLVAQVSKMILEDLKRPGGALDIRYRRLLENEVENYLSRQFQRNTQVGAGRQVIIQMKSQFLNLNGTGNSNTFQQINTYGNRLAEVGLHTKDTAQLLERLIQK